MNLTHTTLHDRYHLIELDGEPEPSGSPIPPRSTQIEAAQSETIQPDVSLADLHPGMACRTPQGHAVRITQILRADSQAEVHLLNNPRHSGSMHLDELTPIPVKVEEGDGVLLHIGDFGFPIQARVVEVSGDYARFFSTKWNEALWGHTAHVLSISPRGLRHSGAK